MNYIGIMCSDDTPHGSLQIAEMAIKNPGGVITKGKVVSPTAIIKKGETSDPNALKMFKEVDYIGEIQVFEFPDSNPPVTHYIGRSAGREVALLTIPLETKK